MAKATDPGKLLSVAQVAEKMGASPKTVRRLVDKKEIGYVKVGDLVRISEAAFQDWYRRKAVDPVL